MAYLGDEAIVLQGFVVERHVLGFHPLEGCIAFSLYWPWCLNFDGNRNRATDVVRLALFGRWGWGRGRCGLLLT